ncbi:branched-chain amino acid aminotransferase [Gallaecimonas kandeliae]|uniref:branched-chain amino acid aminotransferase n=1 Tax=Gallaecimonas kandeliae TaxID=3029055 RepID=UPI002647774D|nr:branched-chain amino acid aminotransferase [Gallaecimonas kandeliae]WKE66486.1 branched-chain amino acid aminotransferase [Gallaecimonas kandeliae]
MTQPYPGLTFEPTQSLTPAAERQALLENPAFGKVLTDHMVTIHHSAEQGWHGARLAARQDFNFAPSTTVLHYGLEIFEGLKAYRQAGGGVALFRPQANARRFAHSARRLAMPPLPEALFVESVKALAHLDQDWIPSTDAASLYLRPFMIATDQTLALKPAGDCLYSVIASPVGPYFQGSGAVSLWVSDNYSRAAPGGTGDAKCGGNYAAAMLAQLEASAQGCDQVVFLDAVERRWVEELGGMNVFFVFDDGSLQTPPLSGTILAGITRDSIIQLARSQGLTVREERYDIGQWQADAQSGRLVEAFACGTAAVVTPIGQVRGNRFDFAIGNGGAGEVTAMLKGALLDIQYGRAEDPFGWRVVI